MALITVLLALVFAWIQNPTSREAPRVSSAAPATAPADPGRSVYEAHGCATCHSIAGVGNPRYPLDGVGTRRGKEGIRDWIVGAAHLEASIPNGPFRMKQKYQGLPAPELDALVGYMQSLRD